MNLAILQARMSSTRLPGKVLAPVLGQPMIARQIERLRRSRRLDDLVVATSLDPSDDPLAAWGEGAGVSVFRGDLHDVLGRFCALLEGRPEAGTVLRLTADCPLADPGVIDALVQRFEAEGADYANNVTPDRTFQHGLDAEVMRRDVLLAAGREARDAYEREHVTPFIYRHPERFRLASLTRSPSLAHLRWTVDLPEDLAFVRRVYERLYPSNPAFSSDDVVALAENSAPIPP
ncbi:MAG: glycosyltransferase family protein [Phenylobacterium sp.]|uniref:glycosyltransferase family protein n=1 Tax=Phenylobacterium sp. TaxID=1871053 RepID=UPI001A433906|nr:glycosyltransferase family protein [Phenylobacterium sp.]MBL8771319.1 glycosyltransferase family protein [Phenylobacterium sp.]